MARSTAPATTAAAVWASSSLTGGEGQSALNQALFRALFGGGAATLGQAAARAKLQTPDMDVRRSWVFFGDPAMPLRR